MSNQISIDIGTLSGDPTTYVALIHPCRLIKGAGVVTTAITTNAVVMTMGDGTTTAGTLTLAVGAAGTVANFAWAANVELNSTTPLKIVCSGTPGAGAANITLEFSEFHVA